MARHQLDAPDAGPASGSAWDVQAFRYTGGAPRGPQASSRGPLSATTAAACTTLPRGVSATSSAALCSAPSRASSVGALPPGAPGAHGAPPLRLSPEALDFLVAPVGPAWSVSGLLHHVSSFAGFLKVQQRDAALKPSQSTGTAACSSRQPLFASLRQWLDFNALLLRASNSSSSSSSKLRLRVQGPPALKETEAVALWGVAASVALIHRNRHLRRICCLHQQQQQRRRQQQLVQPALSAHEGSGTAVFPLAYYASLEAAAAAAAAAAAVAEDCCWASVPLPEEAQSEASAAAAAPLLDAQEEVVEVRLLALLLLLFAALRQQRQQSFPLPEDRWFERGASSPSRTSKGASGSPVHNEGPPHSLTLSLPARRQSSSKGPHVDAGKLRVYLLQQFPQLLQLLQLQTSDSHFVQQRQREQQQQRQQQQQQQEQQGGEAWLAAWEVGLLEAFLERFPEGTDSRDQRAGAPLILKQGACRSEKGLFVDAQSLLASLGRPTCSGDIKEEATSQQASAQVLRGAPVLGAPGRRGLVGFMGLVDSLRMWGLAFTASLGDAKMLRLSSCSKSDIFISQPVEALFVEGLSDCSLVAPTVLGPVFLRDCCRLQLHARAKSLIIDNTLGADLLVACCFPPVILGDSRGLSLGPYNVITRPLQQQQRQQQQQQQQQRQQQHSAEDEGEVPKVSCAEAEAGCALPWNLPPTELIVSAFAFPISPSGAAAEAQASEEPLGAPPFRLVHPNQFNMIPGVVESTLPLGLGFFSVASPPLPQQYLDALQAHATKMLQQRIDSTEKREAASRALCLMLL
ncbi:hypothetical protein Esti_000534 [Eimeria stiedai]